MVSPLTRMPNLEETQASEQFLFYGDKRDPASYTLADQTLVLDRGIVFTVKQPVAVKAFEFYVSPKILAQHLPIEFHLTLEASKGQNIASDPNEIVKIASSNVYPVGFLRMPLNTPINLVPGTKYLYYTQYRGEDNRIALTLPYDTASGLAAIEARLYSSQPGTKVPDTASTAAVYMDMVV